MVLIKNKSLFLPDSWILWHLLTIKHAMMIALLAKLLLDESCRNFIGRIRARVLCFSRYQGYGSKLIKKMTSVVTYRPVCGYLTKCPTAIGYGWGWSLYKEFTRENLRGISIWKFRLCIGYGFTTWKYHWVNVLPIHSLLWRPQDNRLLPQWRFTMNVGGGSQKHKIPIFIIHHKKTWKTHSMKLMFIINIFANRTQSKE